MINSHVCLDFKNIFQMFDQKNTGLLDAYKVAEIFDELGTEYDEDELKKELKALQDSKSCSQQKPANPLSS